ncbi:Putative pyridoxal 5'-phosphate synthase subunit snz3 [Saccharomyces pastorianus]|uniref:pyridoxal 5'-phosphate synthase (glutamine hydrolyzing) n=1 Tax=Saccharomyces pastorianus TaxID=27292 RepID=A0A6C1E1M2_SACPS|nr:Putative pyridoxal 5'-phosphate synthase subunit snz3 [Saccharomyces pastorianus]
MSEFKVKTGLAQMLKGGVIMDVVNAEQAIIAERAGACAVMALELSIPVMAKVRIGHFVEAQILEALQVDYIDESEVLTPADWSNHIEKNSFQVPFVCGAKDLGEALRRINEGAAMIRTKGEAETLTKESDLAAKALELRVPVELLKTTIENGKLPVVNFAAGGVATPADAALLMQLGCEGVFVGSGIFKSSNPDKLARAIVEATTHYDNPKKLLEVSSDLGDLMGGISSNRSTRQPTKRHKTF